MRMCTYSPDVATDHQAHVLGEGVHQVGKGRAGRGVPSHHQTLGTFYSTSQIEPFT